MDERIEKIIELLKREYGENTKCALKYNSPFQLLVATILSAQCTDERVNKVTPILFEKFKTPRDFMNADLKELEELIRSTGFFRNKAKNIKNCSKMIVEKYGGEVPQTLEELVKLPGVARKTANVVLGNYFRIPSGIVVDTHVKRVAKRLGLTEEKIPEKIERDLMKKIPRNLWIDFSNWIIYHGRKYCKARNPECNICPLREVCPKIMD